MAIPMLALARAVQLLDSERRSRCRRYWRIRRALGQIPLARPLQRMPRCHMRVLPGCGECSLSERRAFTKRAGQPPVVKLQLSAYDAFRQRSVCQHVQTKTATPRAAESYGLTSCAYRQ